MTSPAILEGGQDDALIQIGCWRRRWQAAQQADDAGDLAQFLGARGAGPDVLSEAMIVDVGQLTEQVRVDERAYCRAVGAGAVFGSHTLYMTGDGRKVAVSGN